MVIRRKTDSKLWLKQLLALTVLKAVKETSNMPIANYQFVKVQNVI